MFAFTTLSSFILRFVIFSSSISYISCLSSSSSLICLPPVLSLLLYVEFMAYSATLMDYLSLLEQRLFSEGLYEIGGQMRPTQLLGYLDAVYGERLGQPLYCPSTVEEG